MVVPVIGMEYLRLDPVRIMTGALVRSLTPVLRLRYQTRIAGADVDTSLTTFPNLCRARVAPSELRLWHNRASGEEPCRRIRTRSKRSTRHWGAEIFRS